MKKFILLGLLAVFAIPSDLQADLVKGWEFNSPGNQEGWNPSSLNITSFSSDGDSLDGTASTNDPQLRQIGLSFSPAGPQHWDTLVFRVREFQDEATSGFLTTFNPTGLVVQANFVAGGGPTVTITSPSSFSAVSSGDDFFTVTVDISSIGTAEITELRLDPIGGAFSNSGSETNGNSFEIDFIRINSVPEPSSFGLFVFAAAGMVLRRRKS